MNAVLKKLIVKPMIAFFVLGLLTNHLFALDLDSAKNAGLIGEQANGYLGIVSKPAGKDVEKLINDINAKRKTKYLEIAKEQGVDLAIVEKRAGAKVIEKTSSGHYINTGNTWQKK